MKKKLIVSLVILAGLALPCRPGLAQGSLIPAGPPAPTMKTLDQIEPRRPISSLPYIITSPGSYYVTTNLTGVPGTPGITIAVNDVSLDLRGFVLAGVAPSSDGIVVSGIRANVVVMNGTLRNWGSNGLNASTAQKCFAHQLRLCTNGSKGLWVGPNSLVTDCLALANGSDGIVASAGSTIQRSVAAGNADDGIEVFSGCAVVACTSSSNRDAGIEADDDATVTACATENNGNYGIFAGPGCVITDSTARGSAGDGRTGGDGIVAGNGSTIVHCAAAQNQRYGIRTLTSSTVKDCTAHANTNNVGILVESLCQATGNNCCRNYLGIDATGRGNRIDSNLTSSNTFAGIRVVTTNCNVLVKNFSAFNGATGNNNFLGFVGNVYGQFIYCNNGGVIVNNTGWENFASQNIP